MALRGIILLLVGSGAGLLFNAFSTTGIPLRTPDQLSFSEQVNWSLYVEGLRVTMTEAKRAFDLKEAVFIDARSSQDYNAGHIPGALNLPVSELEARGQALLKGIPKDARIIAYCSGETCQSSILLARILIEKLGYSRTHVFFDGWHAWNVAGYPFVIGDVP